MLEYATNLINPMDLVNLIDIKLAVVLLTPILVVVGLVIKWIFYQKEKITKTKANFASDEMREGMMRLRKFERDNSNFSEVFANMLADGDLKADELSMDCGRFAHNFHDNIFENRKKTNDRFVKYAVNIGQVEFLLDIVEPMERAKNPNYEKRTYNECRRIFKDELGK